MITLHLPCEICNAPITRVVDEPVVKYTCPSCTTEMEWHVFNALLRPPETVRHGDAALLDGESTCFYHVSKKATVVCEGCGRFLCSLCDVTLGDSHLCASCVESAVHDTDPAKARTAYAKERRFKHVYTYYDRIALILAMLSCLLFYLAPFLLPVSVYLTVRYWKKPMSAVPRGRWRFLCAVLFQLIACGELVMISLAILHGILS